MEHFQPSEFSITVNQHSILTDNISSKKAYLILSENTVDINLLDNDCFDYVDDSITRYELVVEYEDSSHYDLWTMPLEPNDIECNDFIIKKNEDFFNLFQFIKKFQLQNKLENQLKEKKPLKKTKI